MSRFFQPSWCDEFGNTQFPYILKGTVSADGKTLIVEEPADFKAKCPRVGADFVAESDDTVPRRLNNEEVQRLVAQGRPAYYKR